MTDTATRARPDPWVGGWLLLVCALVFAMVMVGGATRLTDSGLSITEWKPVTGAAPPLTPGDWRQLFDQYRQIPQYHALNRGMTLAEFQYIFWWEWSHRLLGRVIGLAIALPLLAFALTGRLKGRIWRHVGLLALVGFEGFLGWWMVSSGLAGRIFVSPVRLAVHLVTALFIMAYALWLALDALDLPRKPARLGAPQPLVWGFAAALLVQIVFGALLAGARAGAAYADWPTIGGAWFPRTYGALEPFWLNFTSNHAAQHFHHRTLGYVVALLAGVIAALAARRGEGAGRGAGLALGGLALTQAALGIATVIMAAPLGLALTHQAGAALLWLCATVALRTSWYDHTANTNT